MFHTYALLCNDKYFNEIQSNLQVKMNYIEQVFIPSMDKKSFNFAVKIKTGAKSNHIDGVICINGTWYLKIMINAVPKDGKANKAIIDLLAHRWSLPKKSIEIIKGTTNVYKIINIKIDNLEKIIM